MAKKHESLILSCPLIFLDVDPHNGVMEYDFYKYLKSIGYKGIVLWDDIFLSPPMREFWNKIPSDEKRDLSQWGHFSGTGLIVFS